MADFSALKAAIQAAIRQNGNNEITGNIMQGILLSMVNTLGDAAINQLVDIVNQLSSRIADGYMYGGIATPTSTPTASSGKVFYIALQAGTYTQYGGQDVLQGITLLKTDGYNWTKEQLWYVDDVPTENSNGLVKSGGVAYSIFQLQKEQVHLNGETFDGVVKEGKVDGAYIDNNGSVISSYSFCYFFINIKNASEVAVTFTGSDSYIVNVCNVNKQFIRNVANWADSSIVISDIQTVECYLCVSCKISEINNISFSITYKDLPAQIDHNSNEFADIEEEISELQQEQVYLNGETRVVLPTDKTDGAYIDNNGSVISSFSFCYFYINIKNASEVNITFTGSDAYVVNICDISKQFIRNVANWAESSIVVSRIQTGECYLCISCKKSEFNDISLSITYKDLPVQIDHNSAFADQSHAALFGGTMTEQLKLEDTQSGYYNEFGDYQDYAQYRFKNINIAGVSKITIFGTGVASESIVVNLFDKNLVFIKNSAAWASSPIVITNIPQEAYYVNINMQVYDVNKMSVALEYDGMAEGEMVVNDLFGGNEKECLGASQGKVLSDYGLKYDSAFARTRIQTPQFIKGLFLDAGRKYFNPTNIQTLMDEALAAGLNTYIHYFSDNEGFRFGLNDTTVYANGKTYNFASALGDGLGGGDGTNKWLTQSEMDALITYANSLGLEFIPAFDMPGHTGAIAAAMSLSPSTADGANFFLALLEKYVIYFQQKGCRYFNICGDESQISMAIYAPFMNRALRIITDHNMVPLIYNDEICEEGYADPFMNIGALVLGWAKHNTMTDYATIRKSGYNMVNANGSIYYWTLGYTTTTDTLVNNIRTSDIFRMADNSRDVNIKGAIYHIWCDDADADGPDEGDNVVTQTARCIAAFGEAVNNALPSDYVILKSPNGTPYKIMVDNSGNISATTM